MKDWLIAFGVAIVSVAFGICYVLIIALAPKWFALPVGIAVILLGLTYLIHQLN
ncbi:hypothetical protein [Lentilactobacillus hilgardii]|uniref:hypothetical protein n=1 Tax=Lentilactobacillus hilgardii TaxID=1588 RepID=UPI0021A7DF90|nr:hypothetical protein [Lentilactobacillus hilgardii]